jgi:hypothetical protein
LRLGGTLATVVLGAKWAVDLWLAPVLAGLVAVVVSRASAFIERRAWQRDIRRDVYTRFMRAATKLHFTLAEASTLEARGRLDDALVIGQRLIPEYGELSAIVGEVQLFGSDEVFAEALRVTLELAAAPTLPQGEVQLTALSRLMKSDLK